MVFEKERYNIRHEMGMQYNARNKLHTFLMQSADNASMMKEQVDICECTAAEEIHYGLCETSYSTRLAFVPRFQVDYAERKAPLQKSLREPRGQLQ